MEIAVDARQTVTSRPQAPAPADEVVLQRFACVCRQRRVRVWVRVEDAHDALAVAHKLAQPARIQGRLVALLGVGFGQKSRQGLGALDVELGEAGAPPAPAALARA